MITVEKPAELGAHLGQELGASAWRRLSQDDLDGFGNVTGDRNWIHTDPERARRETPFGGTIAQGFLTLSLLTAMSHECLAITGAKRWLNYGIDKLRFTHPVTTEDRVRLRATLAALTPLAEGGTRLTLACTMEIDGKSRPALVADWTMIAYGE